MTVGQKLITVDESPRLKVKVTAQRLGIFKTISPLRHKEHKKSKEAALLYLKIAQFHKNCLGILHTLRLCVKNCP